MYFLENRLALRIWRCKCWPYAAILIWVLAGLDSKVPYWIIQNSWGVSFGEGGFFKMRRGTDECHIESYGLVVVQPVIPVVCPNSVCINGATTLKDCSCKCNGGWSGPSCGKCTLTCQNGGVVSDNCGGCLCPLGFFGTYCEGGFTATPLAACTGSQVTMSISYTFKGSTGDDQIKFSAWSNQKFQLTHTWCSVATGSTNSKIVCCNISYSGILHIENLRCWFW